MKHLNNLIILFSFFIVITSCTMEQSGLTVFAIPGQNGLGSETYYIEHLLQPDKKNPIEIIRVPTPSWNADLGQDNCIRLLADSIQKLKRQHQNAILYATSQGTATALNFLAHSQDKNPQNKIDGLVLEATLASGNSAVHHTATGPLMGLSTLGRVPFSYYWMPYIAKALMPCYWPGGKQPIKSIEKLPTNLPIVIAHSQNDPQLSFNDACALYYGLRQNGNNNAYLMPFEDRAHIQVLGRGHQSAQVLRAILTKHSLLKKEQSIDLSPYQPDPQQFKAQYDALIAREKWHNRLKYVLGTGACAASALAIKALCTKYGVC